MEVYLPGRRRKEIARGISRGADRIMDGAKDEGGEAAALLHSAGRGQVQQGRRVPTFAATTNMEVVLQLN